MCIFFCVCVWYKKMAALHLKRNGSFKKSDHTLKYRYRYSLIVNFRAKWTACLLRFFRSYISFHILYDILLRYKSFAKVIYKLFRSEVLTVTGSIRSVPWFLVFGFWFFVSSAFKYIYIYVCLCIYSICLYIICSMFPF